MSYFLLRATADCQQRSRHLRTLRAAVRAYVAYYRLPLLPCPMLQNKTKTKTKQNKTPLSPLHLCLTATALHEPSLRLETNILSRSTSHHSPSSHPVPPYMSRRKTRRRNDRFMASSSKFCDDQVETAPTSLTTTNTATTVSEAIHLIQQLKTDHDANMYVCQQRLGVSGKGLHL